MTNLAHEVVDAVRFVIGDGPVGLHEPLFSGQEHSYLNECIASTFVSSVGPFVTQFEEELQRAIGVPFAVATVNGTSALHMALKLVGVRSGDEVVLPGLTFVAPANAVMYLGATPHFFDIESQTLGLDPEQLRSWLRNACYRDGDDCVSRHTGRRIGAIVAVHIFGHPCRIDEICSIGDQFGIPVVEDAAEALGSSYLGKPLGSFGTVATLSFNGNKIVTTGGGGAILTADERFASQARHLTTTAKVPHPWAYVHDDVGYNYRMPNLNAALGIGQLEQLGRFVDSKRQLTERYSAALAGVNDVRMLNEPKDAQSNYWLQNLILEEARTSDRDSVIEALNAAGYGARPAWHPIPHLPPFMESPREPIPVVEHWTRSLVSLPSGAGAALRASESG